MIKNIISILQYFLTKVDYLLYRNKIVIGNRPYSWCHIPVPKDYPIQSQTHPSIVYDKKGWNGYSHWLATTPYPNANIKYENPCIYHANIHCKFPPSKFIPIPNNPIVPYPGNNAFNSDPELFFHEEKLYCIVRENENAQYLREIKLISSNDGENWSDLKTVYTSNDNNRELLSPSYISYENKHRIYFLNGDAGIGKYGKCSGIEIIESSSLENPNFKFLSKGSFVNKDEVKIEPWHFDLFKYKEFLYMILCGRDQSKKTIRNPMYTYLAVSKDDINFHIYKYPIIKHLKSYRPSAYVDQEGMLHLYFSIVGKILKDGSDRNIGLTSIPFEELLNELQK